MSEIGEDILDKSNVSNTILKILIKIHDNIYKQINQNYVDVFLCGGASNNDIYIRDSVRDNLKKIKNIRILYPEDLFIEMLYRDKQSDLLSLEKFLADNCDIICIICESPGALVELGAFTNNDTITKVIAVIEKKREKDKSFIMLGPIKLIKKINKDNVIFYSKDNLSELSEKLKKRLISTKFKYIKAKKEANKQSINSIIGLYYFIPIILYFFNSLELNMMITYLRYLFKENKYKETEFDTLFRSSLKLLYKDKLIQKNIVNSNNFYKLTVKGYNTIINVLNDVNIEDKSKLYDSVRFGIISDKYK